MYRYKNDVVRTDKCILTDYGRKKKNEMNLIHRGQNDEVNKI